MSIYDYERNTTPLINKILKKSVLYRNAISSSYWTMPSIASLFTGTYPSKNLLIYDGDVLNKNLITMAEFLKLNNYFTFAVCPHPYVSKYTGLHRGFSIFKDLNNPKTHLHKLRKLTTNNLFKTIQEKETSKKISWHIEGLFDKYANRTNKEFFSIIKKRSSSKPFFAYIHYDETHTPYIIPRFYRNYFFGKNIKKEPWLINQNHIAYYNHKVNMDENDFYVLKAMYDGAIKYLDYKIFEIILFLKENDLFENTMIIIMSDHGDQLGEHGLFFHVFSLYDFLIKIPLVIKYPDNLSLNGVEDKIVQNVDVFPTITDILDISNEKLLRQFQGNSIISTKIKKRSSLYGISELLKPFGPDMNKYKNLLKKYNRRLMSIRTKKYKYIYSTDGKHEFYNVQLDPLEKNNLINTQYKIANEFTKMLSPWLKYSNLN